MQHSDMEYCQHSKPLPHSSHLYDSYDMSNSNMSAIPATPEFELFPQSLYKSPASHVSEDLSFIGALQLTPSELSSPVDALLYSPRLCVAVPVPHPPAGKKHATSARRRAQNRAAQRAFRDRKEKHVRDLEQKLAELTFKYQSLETLHSELNAAYKTIQKTLKIFTRREETKSGSRSAETLEKFLSMGHRKIKIKAERDESFDEAVTMLRMPSDCLAFKGGSWC